MLIKCIIAAAIKLNIKEASLCKMLDRFIRVTDCSITQLISLQNHN